jgi:preprotein translocase subunit SecE
MKDTQEVPPLKKRTPPLVFFKQVRQEMARVVWPSRQEVVMTSILVFVMVVAFAVFFLGVDYVLSGIVQRILGWQTL